MSRSQEAKLLFCAAAAHSSWHKLWIPNTGWGEAIEQVSGKSVNNTVVAKVLNSIIGTEGATFVHQNEEFVVHHNRRKVDKGDGKNGHVHFYWVQPASLLTTPATPSDTLFWQQRFDQYSAPRNGTSREKRSKKQGGTQCSPKRAKITESKKTQYSQSYTEASQQECRVSNQERKCCRRK